MNSTLRRTAPFAPAAALLLATMATANAAEPAADSRFGEAAEEFHPWVHYPQVRTVDLSPDAREASDNIAAPTVQPDFWSLDEHTMSAEEINAQPPSARAPDDTSPADAFGSRLPTGWVQRGNVVLPQEVADGLKDVSTGPIYAVEDIPGNKYPRKHTLFLNFNGGMLFNGSDNSAEDRSNLARQGVYPTFGGSEGTALAIIQSVEGDLAQFGINVVYDFRPRKLVPYTMEMVGGDWTDTNLDMPAGGVAPGADCGALGQRHVVYTFSNGASTLGAAATISQEAGHAWGLDHSVNCDSVMSYCGGGDRDYLSGCNGLCEAACQGAAGCRLTHDMFCGEGNDQQDDVAELTWIFGGNEPDIEPPTVEIVSPADGLEVEAGGGTELRAIVDDNYGGFGWQFIVTKDGEEIYNQPDYDRDVDDEFRAALNLVGLEAGVYVLTVEAEDQFENVTSQSVTIYVGGATTSDSDGSGSDGSDTDGGTSDSASGTSGVTASGSGTTAASDSAEGSSGSGDAGGDAGEASDTESGGAVDDDKGCGCTSSAPPSSFGAGLLIFFAGLATRRRRRR